MEDILERVRAGLEAERAKKSGDPSSVLNAALMKSFAEEIERAVQTDARGTLVKVLIDLAVWAIYWARSIETARQGEMNRKLAL